MDILNSYYLRMKRWNLLKYILNPVDVLSILFAFQISYLTKNYAAGGFFFSDHDLSELFLGVLPFWLVICALVRVTRIPAKREKVLFFLYFQSTISIFFLLTLMNYILRLGNMPRSYPAEISFFAFLFLYFGRLLIHQILKLFGVKGYNFVNTVIVTDDSSADFIENLISKKRLGYKIVVMFTQAEAIRTKFENYCIILPEKFLGILSDLIKVDFIDEVLYLKEKPDSCEVRDVLRTCEDLGITLRLKSKDHKVRLSSAVRTHIANGVFLTFVNIPNNSWAMALKKTLDINIAMLMVIVLSPVFVFLSLLIKITSRGPIISNFIKTGWRGQQIKVYHFRTRYSPDTDTDPSTINTRFTPIGKFLIMSGLDQLPELFNVLKGELTIMMQKHPLQSDSENLSERSA